MCYKIEEPNSILFIPKLDISLDVLPFYFSILQHLLCFLAPPCFFSRFCGMVRKAQGEMHIHVDEEKRTFLWPRLVDPGEEIRPAVPEREPGELLGPFIYEVRKSS